MDRPRLSLVALLLAVGGIAAPTRAELPGIDRSPGHSSGYSFLGRKNRKLIRGGDINSSALYAGWTFDRSSTSPPAPKPGLGGIVAGVHQSVYRSFYGLAIPGIGLGFLLDDGAFSIDVIPKMATLWGLVGAGVGWSARLHMEDTDLGYAAEGWVAVFGGVRLRVTRVEGTTRSSASILFAMPRKL